jgi:Na+/melibiose symporter-like transporter
MVALFCYTQQHRNQQVQLSEEAEPMEQQSKETTNNRDFVYFLISLCLFVIMALLTTDTSIYTRR